MKHLQIKFSNELELSEYITNNIDNKALVLVVLSSNSKNAVKCTKIETFVSKVLKDAITLRVINIKEKSITITFHIGSIDLEISKFMHQVQQNINYTNKHYTQHVLDRNSELFTINKLLKKQIYTNHLTGLPNRLALKKDLKKLDKFGLLYIDIQGFQNINDLFGNEYGDEVLQSFTTFLYHFAGTDWGVYNLGGDEFVLLCYEDNSKEYYEDVAKKLIQNLEQITTTITKDEFSFDVELNIMVTIASNTKTPLEHAHMAMNYAKKEHIKVLTYSESLNLEKIYKDDMKYTKIISEAIKNGQVVPFYQPIVSFDGIVKYEALMRIKNDDGVISPYYFLEVSKKIGKYAQLTKIMVESVFKEFENRSESVSINLVYKDIVSEEIVKFIIERMDHYNMASKTIFEIVESEEILNFEKVLEFVELMQKKGVKISIDDFGSGFSNYSNVLMLRPDIVKIDGSLIKDIDTNQNSYLITKTILNFCEEIGVDSVAEFIHSDAILETVKELGVTYMQGYLLGEPTIKPNYKTYIK
ncbi:MAG: EAL domain-containing protein [Helicobacteraceae bacterium]|nr:EAL domain-containing protein [Helicobacteraceae bacterium]